MIVLQLAPDTYYTAPVDSCGNFGCVGVPWLASDFAFKNEEILANTKKIFKGARSLIKL